MTGKNHEQIADVYRETMLVGKIKRTVKGSIFEYDNDYLAHADPEGGVAHNLLHSQKKHETFGVNLHTFFAGLLPEGLRLEALTRSIKTSKDDLLTLLIAAGTDCIGDITVVPENEPVLEIAPDIDTKHFKNASLAANLAA